MFAGFDNFCCWTSMPEPSRFKTRRSKAGLAQALGNLRRASRREVDTVGLAQSPTPQHAGFKKQMVLTSHSLRGKSQHINAFYEKVCNIGEGGYAKVGKWVKKPRIEIAASLDSFTSETEETCLLESPSKADNKKYFAVKEIPWSNVWGRWLFRDREQERLVRAELEVLLELDHPHIVDFREWFEDPRLGIFFVMELCEGPTFQALLDSTCELQELEQRIEYEPRFRRIIGQIAYALSYIHNLAVPYVHRDLKPDNVLLTHVPEDSRSVAKLIDFGLAKTRNTNFSFTNNPAHRRSGTALFIAPEYLLQQAGTFSPAMDMWAMGVMLVWMITCIQSGKLVHPMLTEEDGENPRSLRPAYFNKEPWNRSLLLGQSEKVFDLVGGLLVYASQEEERMTASEFLNDDWVKELRNQGDALSDARKIVTSSLSSYQNLNRLDRLILSLMAQHSDTEQIVELRLLFRDMDKGSTGSIQKDELIDHFRSHSEQKFSQENLDTIFNELDINGDGNIFYSDWLAAAIGNAILEQEDVIETVFQCLDFTNTGKISRSALEQALGVEDADAVLPRGWFGLSSDGMTREQFKTKVKDIATTRAKVLIQDDGPLQATDLRASSAAATRTKTASTPRASTVPTTPRALTVPTIEVFTVPPQEATDVAAPPASDLDGSAQDAQEKKDQDVQEKKGQDAQISESSTSFQKQISESSTSSISRQKRKRRKSLNVHTISRDSLKRVISSQSHHSASSYRSAADGEKTEVALQSAPIDAPGQRKSSNTTVTPSGEQTPLARPVDQA